VIPRRFHGSGLPRTRRRTFAAGILRRPPSLLITVLAVAAGGLAAEPAGDLVVRSWKLEAIELRDGRRIEGLVLSGPGGVPGPDADDIAFLQVVRAEGRKTHLIGWPAFPAELVRFVERLPDAEHRELDRRVEAFRAGQRRQETAASVRLARAGEELPWRYEGPEFTLESMADSPLTRHSVVRLELVLAALTSLVPPVTDSGPLTVRLCGSLAEYRRLQDELGLRIENPAFYLRDRRLLVAGSELSALVAEGRTAADLLDSAAQRQAALDGVLEARLRRLAADLEQQGMPAVKRAEVVRLARQRWSRERGEDAARIEAARRGNEEAIDAALETFDARLAHEAWHAYADRRLRADGAPGLPAWLDEGIAQVVETAPVEAGEVRLDLFDRGRLVRLQELLRLGGVPPIADVVSGGQEPFVAGHAGADQAVAYLTAWGLALDLSVVRRGLSPAKVRELTAAGEADPVAQFESLVGMPVDRFDREWRERMLRVRHPAAPGVTAPPPSAR
jgi:hypothetical protein